jgi:hypothetical protein
LLSSQNNYQQKKGRTLFIKIYHNDDKQKKHWMTQIKKSVVVITLNFCLNKDLVNTFAFYFFLTLIIDGGVMSHEDTILAFDEIKGSFQNKKIRKLTKKSQICIVRMHYHQT